MNAMQSTSVAAAILLASSSVVAQDVQSVSDGVYVLPIPAQPGTTAKNIGVVEFDDFLLFIDVCGAEERDALSEILVDFTTKPVRYQANTHGTPCESAGRDIVRLVPSATGQTEFRGGSSAVGTDVILGDEGFRAILRRLHVEGGEDAWTVEVGDPGVLFAGDLTGQGRGADPLPVDDWMTELRRLGRLNPDVVVPGSGAIKNLGSLRGMRDALARAKAAITESVGAGRPRGDVVDAVTAAARGFLSETTAGHLYDEYVGILPAKAYVERLGLREGPSPTADSSGWTAPRTVVVADLWPGRTAQLGLAAPNVEVLVARDREHAAELVVEEDADAILGWLTPEIFDRGDHLRWVSLFSAGIESYLAIPGFAKSDVVLTNGQRLYANGGAEHVVGMTLTLSRRLHTAVRLQSERRWDTAPLTGPTPITGSGSELGELRGKTLLVAGLGGIGTEVARLAHGIGMRVVATRASRREGPAFVEYVGLSDELLTLAADADVIVNCLPLTAETARIFDEEFFSIAKPSAFFVNIGRGKTVDTDALVRALREGRIAGAGLDVTEPEPLPADHELWAMPNVIITPHVGGDSERHMERIWLLFRENLRRFAVGEPLLSVVDKQRGY